jgi:hypothetical protein
MTDDTVHSMVFSSTIKDSLCIQHVFIKSVTSLGALIFYNYFTLKQRPEDDQNLFKTYKAHYKDHKKLLRCDCQ